MIRGSWWCVNLFSVKSWFSILTSHLFTTGWGTQSELLPEAAPFLASLSPVPSSVEWVCNWLPWRLLLWWLLWVGTLGDRLISLRSTWLCSSTSRSRSSKSWCSPAAPISTDDWGSSGDRGSLTEGETQRQLRITKHLSSKTVTTSLNLTTVHFLIADLIAFLRSLNWEKKKTAWPVLSDSQINDS